MIGFLLFAIDLAFHFLVIVAKAAIVLGSIYLAAALLGGFLDWLADSWRNRNG